MLCSADATAANWTFFPGMASFEVAIELMLFEDGVSVPRASAGSVSSSCHGQPDLDDSLDAMEHNASRNLGRNWRECE